jgi:hypothetical protein
MAVVIGAKSFTKVVAKSETAYGTAASFNDAAGELLHTDIVGVVDPGVSIDMAEDKSEGLRARRVASNATVTAKAPTVTFSDAPISARNLPILFDALATITPTVTYAASVSAAKAISTIARAGTLVTVTTSASHGYASGTLVSIMLTAGPTGYAALQGTFTVTSTGATTFTYNTAASGTITSGSATGNAYDAALLSAQWAYAPNASDVDTLTTYSLYLTDGIQKFVADGCVPTDITISADQGGLLQAGSTWAARALTSSTDTSTATYLPQNFMPGRAFGLKTKSSFITDKAGTGATAYSSYITNWSLKLNAGAMPLQVLNGAANSVNAGGVAYTGPLDGSIDLTIASNSNATTAFPHTAIGTTKFVQVYGVDANGYGFTANLSGIVEKVSVIGSEQDGMILNTVTLQLAADASGNSILCWVDSPLPVRP